MTKEAELKLLSEMIARFGAASYIGPWLLGHEEQIRWAIKNDILIDVALKIK